ncbi:DUF4136 domain-containing protein [Variovorax sp. OV329]|uniref:DUF4136 domain-containing protein n=1 Tax=Variovorax sp. OV329 TaxID=1882825 RepID=UPI0008EA7A0F|nr:DUF4136 domain-containing protein [Variovorax sp. OV329]SFM23271.1 protein of unknown function [Variovorax sp. OV329]
MKPHIGALILAGLLAACSNTPTVKTDSDPAARFSAYRTYTWIAKPTGGSPLTQQRIADGIDAKLKAKGWQLAPDGDVRIAAHVATQERRDYTTYYNTMGYGWGWGGFGPGVATTTAYTYEVGTLVVDMFDAGTKRAIWRGTATATLPDNSDATPALLQASLDKMFADFPPGSAPAK